MPEPMVGGYRIDGLLGRGGMAEVYKAWNVGLHRHEALKVLPPQMTFDQSFVERFLQEARTAAGLRHPHIATIHMVSPASAAQPYFTMEIVEGGDLADLLHQCGPLPLQDALPILRQTAAALDYAHRQGIIHRDVKPANILLENDSQGAWNVKVVDFGIARAQEAGDGARLTKTGMIVGTPEYMSPEQGGSGLPVDARTDLYSLGVVAYEMLCGHPPFTVGPSGNAISVIIAHIQNLPRPPCELMPDLPPPVSLAILRALAKIPSDRFNTGAEFVAACTTVFPHVVPPLQTSPLPVAPIRANSPVLVTTRTPIQRTTAVLAGLICVGVILIILGLLHQASSSPVLPNHMLPNHTPHVAPPRPVPVPSPVPIQVSVSVCIDNGLLAGRFCPHRAMRPFGAGKAPTKYCSIHTGPTCPKCGRVFPATSTYRFCPYHTEKVTLVR